jgi:Ca2+-binding RTX toxin-like protein
MSRYRFLNPSTDNLFNVFTTSLNGAATATLIRVNNSDGTITEIVGTGLTLSGSTATAGNITSITRLTAIGGTVLDVFDQPSGPSVDVLINFWNAANGTLRRQSMLSLSDSIVGSTGADTLYGDGANDTISGGDGADTIYVGSGDSASGGNGDDTFVITMPTGPVTLSGGAGTDTLDLSAVTNNTNWTSNEIERLIGGSGSDSFTVSNLASTTAVSLSGANGNDTLRGAAGNDTFIGGNGDDELFGYQGVDSYEGGAGLDIIFGRQATGELNGVFANMTDTSQTVGANTRAARTMVDAYGNIETINSIEGIEGTGFADTLVGGADNNWFRGSAGNDILIGGDGFDQMTFQQLSASSGVYLPLNGVTVTYSGGGSGTVNNDGYGGVDTFTSVESIRGTQFGDSVTGDNADNVLRGLGGVDSFSGGDGYDELDFSQDAQTGHGGLNTYGVNINLATGTGTDGYNNIETFSGVERVRGTGFADTIIGSNASEEFVGNSGNDSFAGSGGGDFMRGGAGLDTLNGVAGSGLFGDMSAGDRDWAVYNDGGILQGVIVNLDAGVAVDGFNGLDTLFDIERVRGTNFADNFLGSSTQNFRQERYDGLGGADTINGQGGYDVASYQADANNGGTAAVNVNLGTGVAIDGFGATDTLISIEGVLGTAMADTLVGSNVNNVFRGNGGADQIDGGDGIDTIELSMLNDQIGGAGGVVNMNFNVAIGIDGAVFNFTSIEAVDGSYRNDTIVGGTGADNLFGSLGDDYIDGGDGNDTVNGGAGVDQLIGGAGNDWIGYVFDLSDPAQNAADASAFAQYGWTTQNWNWTGVNVNLATNTMSGLDGAVDSITGFENIFGTYLNDTLTGDAGDNGFRGYSGNDSIDGGGGTDTVFYSRTVSRQSGLAIANMTGDVSNGIDVNLATGVAQDGNGSVDTLISIENVVGSIGNDTITGSAVSNILTGGLGADQINGGDGWDTASYAGATATVQVIMYAMNFNSGDAAGDTFTGIEALQGSSNIDVLVGDFAANAILGGDGGDWIDGTFGGDYLYGEGGDDNLVSRLQADVLDGGDGLDYVRYDFADTGLRAYLYDVSQNSGWAAGDAYTSIEGLVGSYQADDLRGDAGLNVIVGQGGADFIIGLGGVDYMNGGADGDYFHYVSPTDGGGTGDVIQDFTSGLDKISITGSIFGLGYLAGGGIESFRFTIGTSAIYATSQFIFDSATSQLWYDQDGTGAGAQILMATLQSGASMAASDFLVL